MKIPPLQPNEADRLKALESYKILDTVGEQAFDDLTALAAHICGTPIALVSLVDAHRQWFKSKFGLSATETPRKLAFCTHAILQPDELLIVPNALLDERFATNPLVTSDPNIRFYAGAPLITPQGYALGTLCVIDRVPRQLQPQQVEALQILSRQVVAQLELHRNLANVVSANQELELAQEALRQSENQYRSVVNNIKEVIFQIDAIGLWTFLNSAWTEITGFSIAESIGTNFLQYVHPDDRQRNQRLFEPLINRQQESYRYEVRYLTKDGSYRWIEANARLTLDTNAQLVATSGTLNDITERKQAEAALLRAAVAEAINQKLEKEIIERKRAEAQLFHNAFHDVLTGLPNRALFMDRLAHAVVRTKRRDDCLFAVLFLDVDRFKVVNDSLGHLVGDELLQRIAQRLEACVRSGDTVARLGGDEFTILLEDIKDISEATQIAERLQEELALPFVLNKHEVFTAVSIGIALSSNGCEQPEELLRNADIAMYYAKNLGRARYSVFDPAMHTQAVVLLQLETDLRLAVEHQDFRIHYQPIVSLKTGRITGFEALVRWQHPLRGLLSPAEFISVAEETGLIIPIGRQVLHEACRQMRTWLRQFPTQKELLTLNVNLSVKQFMQAELVTQVAQILQETGLDARSLKLEITESVIMENTESATVALLQLKALGVQLCMDDFGTGYSSLSYLHRFPIDILKIDRSFVNNMTLSEQNLQIVQAIVTLAHNLNMAVTAEGVETTKQLAQLKALRCEFGQGYFFSRPVDSLEAGALIADEHNEKLIWTLS